MRTLVLSSLAVVVSGCPNTAVYRTADPVAPGAWRVGGGLSAGVLADREQETRLPTAQIELSARRGLLPDVDVGARLYTAGLHLDATWRVWRARCGCAAWALSPFVGGLRAGASAFSPPALHLFAGVAAIGTRALGGRGRWSISGGPLAGWGLYYPETGGHAQGAWIGGFVNLARRAWGRWWLVPELGVLGVVAGEVPVRGGGLQAGVGLVRDLD